MALVFDLGPHAADALAANRHRLATVLDAMPGVRAVAMVPDSDAPNHTHIYLVAEPRARLSDLRRHAAARIADHGMTTASTLHLQPSP